MIKRNITGAGRARTGPVNLALWRVPMTRGFTGHKPRGMRESRKWPTVSIFCQAASRLRSLSLSLFFFFNLSLCVCLCVSLIQIIPSSSVIQIFCSVHDFSLFVSNTHTCLHISLSVDIHHKTLILTGTYWNSTLKVRISVCRDWMQSSS